ncbi:MAG: glycoside hydrolase family 3 protein [Nocardioides sp.]|uniref:glycoside hydrolase family 3 protein n=1 Tax=Nocardioides sp. TaxID=35761 RepID=UPI003F10A732
MPGPLTSRAIGALTLCLLATGCSSVGGHDGDRATAAPERARTASATRQPAADPSAARRLGLRPGWGPTEDELERAAELVGGLTVRQLAGQVIVASWSGTEAPTEIVERLHLGGVIAFGANITSTDQIRRVNRRLQRADDREWPLLIGVDQEGGLVERVRGEATRFPTFMTAGAAQDDAVTTAAYRASGLELRHLGFTTTFAPVADVTRGPADPVIGSRSASDRPGTAAFATTAASAGLAEAGVVGVLKHFPGHGSVTADSHHTLPVQRRSLAQLRRTDLVPFRHAVQAGASAVMTGHLDVRAVDAGVPASLSRKVVTGLLREELGFEGLVVTDSLSMAGVAAGRTPERIAVRAIRAGNDVLLMPSSPRRARDGLVAAVRGGSLDRQTLARAAARQVALLLHQSASGLAGSRPGSSRQESRAYSAAALTVVAGPCRGRLTARRVVAAGDPAAVAAFRAAAQRDGLRVLSPRAPKARRRGATTVTLVGSGGPPRRTDVLVATDRPYVLGASRARVRIATYGVTPGAMAALVAVLRGRERAPGRLPVRVPGVPRQGC